MSLYMKIDGILGDISIKNYTGWMHVQSFNFTSVKPVSTEAGRTNLRSITKPKISDIQLTKRVDCASPLLFQKCCEGAYIESVRINACNVVDAITPYYEYILSNVVINSYHIQGLSETDSHVYLYEELVLNFSKIEMRYTGQDSKNLSKSPITSGYDLKLAKTF